MSHRLARLTGSQREAVLISYLTACLGGVIATFVTQASIAEGYVTGVAVLAAGLYGIWWFEKAPRR